MPMAKNTTLGRRLTSLGLGSLGALALLLLASQLRCAEAESGWNGDDAATADLPGGGDGGTDGGEDSTKCYTGTATSELQLLNHCTEAERVERATKIPTKTWDGKSPLPYSQ
jgi:hypothetical protein